MKAKRVAKRSATRRLSTAAVVSEPQRKNVAPRAARSASKGKVPKGADTFTVRDLNRRPQDVLAAVDKFGSAHINARSGRRYLIQSDSSGAENAGSREVFHQRLDELHAKMRKQGSTGFTAEGWETFSKVIAGE